MGNVSQTKKLKYVFDNVDTYDILVTYPTTNPESKMQKFAKKGNEKLGEGAVVVSRAVGDSCPPSCAFLGDGCYAENTEKIYKNSRAAGLVNMLTDVNLIRSMIVYAIKKVKDIRWHERGDWFKDGELDREYIDNVVEACEGLVAQGHELPKMWFYTHIYDSYIVDSLSPYCTVYASVHNIADKREAEAAGFKLFAWCDTDLNYAPKKPHPTAKKKVKEWQDNLPKLVVIDNERFITCPEIKRGRGKVSCSKSKNTVECRLCIDGLANVLFPNH